MICTHPVNDGAGRTFPCGRCINCRINRGQEWSLRLLHELDFYESAIFLTLTYSNEKINSKMTLIKKDVQDFMKRLRNELGDRRIKYYLCGEYGDQTNRPHYHAIMFGLDISDRKLIEESWSLGYIYIGSVTSESINYVTRYINKKLYGEVGKNKYKGRLPPFSLMSKGLGLRWMKANENHLLTNIGLRRNGRLIRMPRYYMKKLGDKIPIELLEEYKIQKSEERIAKAAEGRDRCETELARWSEDAAQRHQAELDSEFWQNIYKSKL